MSALGRQVAPVWYEVPVFYFTNPAAVIGPTGTVPIAPGSTQFDYELEAAVVIGRGGGDIPVEDAMAHVAGYTILNDWSARDLQDQEMAVGLGPAKGKDTATSLGPYLVTPDELDPGELSMTAHVNGVEYSRGTLGDLYWSFAQMISYASRGTQLHPGDVIGSGTVGSGCILELSRVHGGEAYPWLRPGDEVRLEIDGLGHQTHQIAAGAPPHPLGAPARTRTEARQ
jgi:2-keto-4-pentenoate hydratase/2-oxohepta-3-ene-1,7-dioic acid hydratase in catechol pathway